MAIEGIHRDISGQALVTQATPRLQVATAAELAAYTGTLGEIYWDSTNSRLVIMDGVTAGGAPLGGDPQITSDTINGTTHDIDVTGRGDFLLELHLKDIKVTTDDSVILIQLETGSTLRTSGYNVGIQNWQGDSVTQLYVQNANGAGLFLHGTNAGYGLGNAAGEVLNSKITIFNPFSTANDKHAVADTVLTAPDGNIVSARSFIGLNGTGFDSAVTGIRITSGAGTTTITGSAKLYGKQA